MDPVADLEASPSGARVQAAASGDRAASAPAASLVAVAVAERRRARSSRVTSGSATFAESFDRLRAFVTKRVQSAHVSRSRTRWLEALLAVSLATVGCGDARGSARTSLDVPLSDQSSAGGVTPRAEPVANAVLAPIVLITIDGVRWQEIFEGTDPALSHAKARPASEIVPNISRLASSQGAAIGAPRHGTMTASGPHFVSLPGYTEILTGRPHGCQDNDCPRTREKTLLDEAHEAGAKVAAFASWERLALAASSRASGSFTISCGRGGNPAIDPAPGWGDYRPDSVTADVALAFLASERPDVLYLGLGDSDEYAHHGDYAGYLSAIRHADDVVGRLERVLAGMGERGARTSIVVTADHGRARDFKNHGGYAPESARVWLVAAGPITNARGWVASPRERHLADIAPTLRVVLGLPADEGASRGAVLDELLVAER